MSEITGEFYPGEFDPILNAIGQSLVDATGGALDEFIAGNVLVISPEETDEGIDGKIKNAFALKKGLCLLLVAGSGKNPDTEADGPLVTVQLEMQLFVSSRIRAKTARPVLELVAALARFFHHAEIRPSGVSWYEKIKFLGYDPLQDPDFTAYAINFEREFQL